MERINNLKTYYRNRSRSKRRGRSTSRRRSIDDNAPRREFPASSPTRTGSDASSTQCPSPEPRGHSSHVESEFGFQQFSDSTEYTTSVSALSQSIYQPQSPFEFRYGRRYIQGIRYPLPADLAELQRQNLSTLLTSRVLGGPICAPVDSLAPPRAVLDLGCGAAYWSAICHDSFDVQGLPTPSFTGLDIVPVASDLKEQGVDWTFVQHDLRHPHLPFGDDTFDLVLIKDMSLAMERTGQTEQRMTKEILRILRSGGTLEIQNTDLIIKRILPNPSRPANMTKEDESMSRETGTYCINSATPFAPCANPYLRDFNKWMLAATDRINVCLTPGASVEAMMMAEGGVLKNFEYKRVAVPLAGPLSWEEPPEPKVHEKRHKRRERLTAEQMALRHTALQLVIQLTESLETSLKDISGKNDHEWATWWGAMTASLSKPEDFATGECLEVGSCWARKI